MPQLVAFLTFHFHISSLPIQGVNVDSDKLTDNRMMDNFLELVPCNDYFIKHKIDKVFYFVVTS